ncbi:MAG: hypothetical protein ABJ311_09540 [Erythrobacter sp.]
MDLNAKTMWEKRPRQLWFSEATKAAIRKIYYRVELFANPRGTAYFPGDHLWELIKEDSENEAWTVVVCDQTQIYEDGIIFYGFEFGRFTARCSLKKQEQAFIDTFFNNPKHHSKQYHHSIVSYGYEEQPCQIHFRNSCLITALKYGAETVLLSLEPSCVRCKSSAIQTSQLSTSCPIP